ncbi:hypothetical protein ACFU67_21520 [Streptomyces rhizosphaericola]|uniref:hypothetical protein n=1 Tax=Streptomyces TaxID=1883 RepID=UPI00048A5202|nr:MULTISPECIES: hypothetical protein [unclassified Streptomyces]MYT89868.1 hypothetical protein [Streptomyces sp. SID8359]PWS42769.1 hypothetical protein DKT74_20440 [Streptomyces sp. ZEA17I]
MSEPFVNGDVHHRACGICPSRVHAVGDFDVFERPTPDCPFSKTDGHRYSEDGTPVCVHPEKVGLPAGRYKSENAPLAFTLDLPPDPSEVVPYLREVLWNAAPVLLDELISQAQKQMVERFPEMDPLTVMRRALG